MIIKKLCDEKQHKNIVDRIVNNDIPYIIEVDTNSIHTYRQMKSDYTIDLDVVYEQGISFKNDTIFDLLYKNQNNFCIFEALPTIFSINRSYVNDLHTKFISESHILTDINIISNKAILIERSEAIGNIYIVTDDKKLFSNLKMRL